jgi:adenylate kinase family enzyme
MKNKRIWIFGGTASGKTTLAKEISKKLKIPFYSIDNFVYKPGFCEKHSEKERDLKLKNASKKKSWIIEGVHRESWIQPAFKKANFVIILKPRRLVQMKRVISRWINAKKSKDPLAGSFKDNFLLLKYAWIYKKDNFVHHQRMIREHNKKYILLKNNKEISSFVEKLK